MILIEHNLDVLKTVDYLIDLGPEGGDGGGQIIAQGTPAQVTQCAASYTGRYLVPYFSSLDTFLKTKTLGTSGRNKSV